MIRIQEIQLIDILPEPLKKDKTIAAIAKVLQKYIDENYSYIRRLLILPNIDDITDERLIDHLAYQFHVDFYDQYLDIDKKKELVKNAIFHHRKKGTVIAVEETLYTIFGRSKLEEWFEYGGDPYHFRINIEATEEGVSESSLEKLDRLINAYKNTRSWLEHISIFLTSRGTTYIAAYTAIGEEITVYPWSISELESKGEIKIGAAISQTVETTTIYPKEVI